MAAIDTAFVEILPDFDRFGAEVNRAISDAGRDLQRAIASKFDGLDRSLDGVTRAADDAGDKIARDIGRGGDRAERALDDVGDKGEKEFDRLEREAKDAGNGMGSTFKKMAGVLVAAFAVVQVGQFFKEATLEAQALNSALANTDQIIETTGQAAGLLTEDVRELSRSLSLRVGVDSVQVQEAANVLLTFRNVSSDTFETALGLAADLSSVLGTDLQGATLQIGKALNDPVKGVNALARAGVQFTQQQKDQIATLVESGNVLGAQEVILAELEGQVGGTAEASADSTAKISNAFTELKRALGGPLIAAIDQITPALIAIVETLEPVFGSIGEMVGHIITQLGPIIEVIGGALAESLMALRPIIPPIAKAFLSIVDALAPLLPLAAEIITMAIQPLATVVRALVTAFAPVIDVVRTLIESALERLQPIMTTLTTILIEVAGVIGDALLSVLPILVEIWSGLLDAVLPLLPPLLDLARSILPVLASLWDAIMQAIRPLIPVVLRLIQALLPILPPILDLIQALLPPLVMLLTTLLTPILALLTPIINLASILITLLIDSALTPLIELIIGLLQPLLEALVGNFGSLEEPIQTVGNWFTWLWENALQPALENIQRGWDMAWAFLSMIFGNVQRGIRMVAEFVRGRIEAVVNTANRVREFAARIRANFQRAVDSIRDRIAAGVRLVAGLPGRILGALGNVGRLLWDAGRRIIQGLIDGIRSMIGNVGDAVGGVVSRVRDYLPFSPAKVGPLSGPGSPDIAGERIVDMIAAGVRSQMPALRDAAERMAGTLSVASGPGAGSSPAARVDEGRVGVRVRPTPAGREPVVIQLVGDANDETQYLLKRLRKAVRIGGGNVQFVLGGSRTAPGVTG